VIKYGLLQVATLLETVDRKTRIKYRMRYQPIKLNAGSLLNLATTWWTSAKHHLPVGFFVAHWQFLNLFSALILSKIDDLQFSR